MSAPRFWLAALLLAAGGGNVRAQGVDGETLGRQLKEQQQARTGARELADEVLAAQWRQLEENGLTDLDLARDIRALRDDLQAVIDEEMTDVIELLAAARSQSADHHAATFTQARQMIRGIVRELSAARMTVLRRMKVAELAGRVQKLIQRQSAVQSATAGWSQEVKQRQAVRGVKVLEDQRDVQEAFQLLMEMMADVRTWGEAASSTAADGLKLAADAEIAEQIDRAVVSLENSRWDAASAQQESVLRNLRELLALLLQAQGLGVHESRSAGDRISELIAQQEAIRTETQELDPGVPPAESLVERQLGLKGELADLENSIGGQVEAGAHLEQAALAAAEAAALLFEARQESAVSAQSQVLEHLAAMEPLLKNSAKPTADRSAAEFAREVRELTRAREKLAEARNQWDSAVRQATTDSAAAASLLAAGAATAKQAKDTPGLSQTVKNRVEEAAKSLHATAERFSQPSEPMPTSPQPLFDDSEAVLTRAMAAVDAALRDAERQQAAVAIGEWARAAEVLERAASEEREIARGAQPDAKASETTASTQASAARQENVADVAEKVAEGLAETAPETARQVAEARDALLQTAELPKASTEPSQRNSEQPADGANGVADKFSASTQELRKKISATAGELSQNNAKDAENLAAARTAIEQFMQRFDPSMAASIERLGNARQEALAATQRLADAKANSDAGVQQQANLSAQAAETLAAADAPAAAEALGRAVDAGENARQELARGEREGAARAQALSEDELHDAVEKIDSAIDELMQRLAEQMRANTAPAKQLREQAAGLDLGAFESLEGARASAAAGSQPQSTPTQRLAAVERFQRHLARAIENLSAKEEEIRRQRGVADHLADRVREQDAAAEVMAQQRREGHTALTDPKAVEALAAAMDQFAESQEAIGEGSVELSGQAEVANSALREALQLAAKLSRSMAASEAADQAMPGNVDRTMPEKREPMAQTEIPKAPAHQRESAGAAAAHDPLGDADDIVLPVNMKADLGTGFVPKSPDVTAQMMIGSEMRAAMEQADPAWGRGRREKSRGKRQDKSLAKRKSKESVDEATDAPDDMPKQEDVAGGVAQMSPNQSKTSAVDNSPVRAGALQRQQEGTKVAAGSAGERGSETDATGNRKSREAPWLVKLPPELRRSIRAGAQQRAPKAYEARLREYFESVD